VAWYNKSQTIESVKNAVAARNWLGKTLIWQYASDGDINNDGRGDGIALGMTYRTLDLNGWLGTEDEYLELFGKKVTMALYKVKILINNLLVRNGPGITYNRLRRADFPAEYDIYQEKNGYGRISQTLSEWISLNPEYVQKLSTVSDELSDAGETGAFVGSAP